MGEWVIWALKENYGVRVGAHPAHSTYIPFSAEIITRVLYAEKEMMLRWARRRARRGWSIEKMKAACE